MPTSNKGIIASLLRIVEKLDVITNWGSNGKGAYAGGTQYQKGDLVSYNGLAYVAITATIGNLPTVTTYWQQITVAGPTGATGPAGVAGAAGIVGGISFGYLFSTTTADADPGSGLLRLNHATPASATQIYLDDNDKNAVDIQAFLRTLDDSTSTNKTRVILIKESDLTKWAIYDVTAVTEAAGYFKLTVTFVAANSTFANNDVIAISCSTVGDKGATGATGAAGSNGTNGTNGATGASGGTIQYAADAGASDAYVISVAGPVAYVAGDQYLFRANTVNTGPCTLNVNAIGAKTIKKNNDQDLADGDIEAGQLVLVAYNATDDVFEMLSQLGNASAGVASSPLKEGFLNNGKISVTVSANDITVSLKTLAGADPSAGDPVTVVLGGTERTISSALSVTKNDGTNWSNAGSVELGTNEIDWFAYIGWNQTLATAVIGFSRISHAERYGDFVNTSTDEKFHNLNNITSAQSSDPMAVIGRFAATLSLTGTGFLWSVPTYTPINLIQRAIYETRDLLWVPVWTGFSTPPSGTFKYKLIGSQLHSHENVLNTSGTSNATGKTMTLPFKAKNTMYNKLMFIQNSGTNAVGIFASTAGSSSLTLYRDTSGNSFTASGNAYADPDIILEI